MIASSGVLLADEAHARCQVDREGGPISHAALVNGNAQWREDVLGHGFEATELMLLPDAEGEGLGLGLTLPVLVMPLQRSQLHAVWSPKMLRADVVIDVDAAAHRAVDLGSDVTIRRFDGGAPPRGAIGEAGESAGVGRDRELASSSHVSGSGEAGAATSGVRPR